MQQFVSELLLFSGFLGVFEFKAAAGKNEKKKVAGACENSSVGLHSAWAAWRDKKTKNIPVIIFKQQQQPPAHVQAGQRVRERD